MNYFEYNGIRSSDMGLHIQRKNVYSSPKYDSSFVSIPGRNGDLIVPNRRYENTQVSYSVYLSAKNSQQLALERIFANTSSKHGFKCSSEKSKRDFILTDNRTVS